MSETVPVPASVPANPPGGKPLGQIPVVVKKYANRRLYNTETSSYITLENLGDMIRAGRDFVVYDAKSGEDITRGVLTQIIVDEESKGTSMLPTPFLRQLIGFYGDSFQGVVPRYLETAMTSFARQQQQLRQVVTQTFSPFIPAGVEEMSRQNLAMIERAMSLFNPFHRGSEPVPADFAASLDVSAQEIGPQPPQPDQSDEVAQLRQEVENLRHQLSVARSEAVLAQLPSPPALPEPQVDNTVVASAVNVMADPPALSEPPLGDMTSTFAVNVMADPQALSPEPSGQDMLPTPPAYVPNGNGYRAAKRGGNRPKA